MRKFAVPLHGEQAKVNAYFESQSSYWKDIYASRGVQGEIYRERHAAVRAWIDSLGLAPGSQVLEIGCGAGFMAIALAQRGLRVQAIDSAEAMVEQARQHAAESGVAELLSVEVGHAYPLAFEDGFFDLVLIIGVIPWLERPELAIQEMARVTKPGGHIILTTDNRARLIYLFDPWLNPALQPLRKGVKAMLARTGLIHRSPDAVNSTLHPRRFIDAALARAELLKMRGMTLGFGPFSFLRCRVIPEPLGTMLHCRLQRFADRDVPGFRSTGAQYLVLARRSASWPQSMSTENPASDATKAP